ncbi:MAG: ABC transporter ATP-binding protein [Planctomycetota bacterium]
MPPLLDIRDLRLVLGDFVLGKLSLSLAAGDYLLLLGPSGCGKTSLLRTIAGFHRADEGALRLDGAQITGLSPRRRRVGYVAQTIDLFDHLSVRDNIAFGLRYQGMTRAARESAFARIVDLLRLRELLGRYPATLSGGESKRVALARSLVVQPRVLLLDEPVSMLDYNARAQMLAVLRMLHGELGTATIHVTHDREEAWAFGSRCAVMREGRIEQTGDVNELFRAPRTRFVAEFLGFANVFPARFAQEDGVTLARLDWAQFELPGPVPFEDGYLGIRPETVEPATDGTPGSFRGRVVSVADRGAYREVRIEVASDVSLIAHLAGGASQALRAHDALPWRCSRAPHPIGE